MAHLRRRERTHALRVRRQLLRAGRTRTKPVKPAEARVVVPNILALQARNHHSTVTRLLARLRAAFASGRSVVFLDFADLEKVVSGGMLLLYAELERLISAYPKVRLKCNRSRDDTVNEVLEHLSIFHRCGYTSGVIPARNDVVSWRATTSEVVDGEKAGELIESFQSLVGPKAKALFRGTSEAITNVVYHAYDYFPDRPGTDKRWWMFCREDAGALYVAVCDRGMGIPESLPSKFPGEYWRRLVKKFTLGRSHSDSAFIRAAVQMERTRTDQKNRGKGLGDVVRVARDVAGSHVYIFSNRGLLSFSNNRFSQRDYRHSIDGTLIVWVLPLHDESEADAH